jgi:hypothetical protein
MKRVFLVFALLFVLFLPARAHASEAWILNIPVRGIPNQETGEVRMLLELNAAPAGSQLVINGATTINLGGSAMVAGDNIKYESAGGNNVKITYQVLSNFNGDFCQGGAAQEKNVPMRFSGAQDVTAYRISTYVVAAPLSECSQVSKHTGDTPAAVLPNDDGVAPALSGQFKGRMDFDVVLVLDKSGSMNDLPPGANAGANKITILKSAVQGFVSQWEQIDMGSPGFADYSPDRIGLVYFDSTAHPQNLPGADPPANFFLQRGTAQNPPFPWDTIISSVNALSPGSSTSIGGGVNEAMSDWKNDPKNDLDLIVVTDGMQNTAPLIQPTGTGFLGLAPVAGFPQELRKRFVPLHTVAFGTPAQVDDQLLKSMSLETSGASYQDVNATDMFDTFGMTLVAILKGNTISVITRRRDTLTGAGPSTPSTVLVDRSAQRVEFSVEWPPPTRLALDLDVFPPGAVTPAVPTSSKHTAQASIQTFDIGRAFGAGVWTVKVRRGENKSTEPTDYLLDVFANEKHLDYQYSLDNLRPVTGDTLNLHVLIDWDGKPLTGLPDGAIRARVLRQPEAMGTILHNTRREGPTTNTTTPAGDILTPLDAKIASFKGQSLLERITPKEVAVITLKDQGKGIYAGSLADTPVPGTYAFETIIDFDSEKTGHVHREERLEENVRLRADPGKTDVKLTTDASGITTLTVTPRDQFGNFFGPGYAPFVHARVRSGGKLRSDVPDDTNQIGAYTFTIAGAPGVTPAVDVIVDGVFVLGGGER